MVWVKAFEEYQKNFVTALSFLLLGLFVLVFSFFGNTFVGSGSVFLEYNVLSMGIFPALAQIAVVVLYLAFFSVFLTVMVFAVRQSMAKVKFQTYLRDFVPQFALEMFEFWVLFCATAFLLGFVLLQIGVPLGITALILFVLAALVSFVPQSIVVDELSWLDALPQALHFFFSNKSLSFVVLVTGVVLLGLLPFIELFFDQFSFLGRFVSLFLVLAVILPFLETLKTVAYLSKFDLIRNLM